MRPINLIPAEERGAHGGIARTGPLVYILVGSLAVLLIGVVMLVLTSNKISDRESEVVRLEAQKAKVTAETSKLAPYVSFERVAKQRIETVADLADSRFDWVRVIHQLSLILPPGSSIEHLNASSGGGSEGGTLAVTSPALGLAGCAPGQNGTAAVVAAMKQIDGVTRVGLSKSAVGGAAGEGESKCSYGDAQFELTVAFDEAPPSPDVAGQTPVAEPTTAETEGSPEGESAESEGATEGDSSGETAVSLSGGTEGAG
jgi:Tfp pilus assembly protein PilN